MHAVVVVVVVVVVVFLLWPSLAMLFWHVLNHKLAFTPASVILQCLLLPPPFWLKASTSCSLSSFSSFASTFLLFPFNSYFFHRNGGILQSFGFF